MAASTSTYAAVTGRRCWAHGRCAGPATLSRRRSIAGAACSYENEQHAELAELLCRTVPCLERVSFTGSGTEATMPLPAPRPRVYRPGRRS